MVAISPKNGNTSSIVSTLAVAVAAALELEVAAAPPAAAALAERFESAPEEEAPAGVLVVTEGHSSKIPRASLGSVTVATCEE